MTEEKRSTEEIREDIEHTRKELGDTAAAVAQKADVKGQAKVKVSDVKEKASAKAESIKETAAAKRASASSRRLDDSKTRRLLSSTPLVDSSRRLEDSKTRRLVCPRSSLIPAT